MHEKDVFCKIVDGEIPCYKLYEDDDVLAFLDISQVTKGHALVISKKHYENFLSTPQEVMHKVMDVAQRIGQVSIKLLGAKGVNILSNCYIFSSLMFHLTRRQAYVQLFLILPNKNNFQHIILLTIL